MYSRVYVEITNICNMNCSFCHGHSRTPRRMSTQEFSRVLDQLKGQTEYIYYHLMGEPLTHPELPSFIGLATQRGFRSIITTNGTLLKKHGDEIISSRVHKVSISLHSFEENNAAAYEKYLTEVSNFAERASAAGIIVVFRLWNRGYDEGRNQTAISFLRSRLDGEWADNTKGIRIRKKLYLEWGDRFEWPDKDAPEQTGDIFCYGMRDHFAILCDGSVVPCCMDSEGIIKLGNVFEDNISDILASSRAKAIAEAFERRTASEDLCRRCAYAQKFV